MIRLSRLTDYAVVLLGQMVRHPAQLLAASDLVEQTGLPMPTVSKIMKQLARTGLVSAQRGAAGGYKLARPAGEISIATLIEAIDGPIAITDCAEGAEHDCQMKKSCPMMANWNRVNIEIRRALERISLEDMAGPSLGTQWLAAFPASPVTQTERV
ncbi:MAG: SUF system Fe-S cluster assembly regulator [Alphaproteobacteria bacterium]|nr:SUF system Fe-S cluster assembly regulator [Alphaproteobacteria bacterium]MBV8548964.1 SUF system Fe-S cluster assembly regulator [Alphaproteobacteria bacterium]